MTFAQIKQRYEAFLDSEKADQALKRMIYRDINTLSNSLRNSNTLLRPDVSSFRIFAVIIIGGLCI